MNNKTSDEKLMGKLVLDIGGLDKMPTDRGLTVKKRGDFTAITVAQNDMFATIELTKDEVLRLREALASDLTQEECATEALNTIFDVSNKMCTGEEVLLRVFNEAMGRQHRTLIQKFWGVIAAVIKEYAATKEGWYDLRNEDSVKWAREVAKVESHMRYI